MWADFEEDGLIGSLIFNATRLKTRTVYQGTLQALTLDEPLVQLSVREFEDTTTITVPVPSFRRYTQLFLLPDNLIDETWTLTPTIPAGVHRWWIDPLEGTLTATLQTRGETTQTLVYYSIISEPYPISLEALVIPDRQEVGRPVELQTWFVGGGRIVTDTERFSVEASIKPENETVEMTPNPDGRFTYSISRTISGTYTVTFDGMCQVL